MQGLEEKENFAALKLAGAVGNCVSLDRLDRWLRCANVVGKFSC